ncbi:MAG: acetoacetate--CoA ligase [Pseudomonadota bacterium]
MTKPLWQPSADSVAAANMTSFIRMISTRDARFAATVDAIADPAARHDALHAWSLSDVAGFWDAIWDFCDVVGEKGSPPYLLDADKLPGARFFPEAQLNFAENLLRGAGGADGDQPALIFRGEDKADATWTFNELSAGAAAFQALLTTLDIKAGDRVAAIMPNMPETIAAMLGASASGAVWSSCSPDFGVKGVLDRFSQIAPRVLVAVDGYWYNGKRIDVREKLVQICAALPSVERVVLVPYAGDADLTREALDDRQTVVTWPELMQGDGPTKPTFVPLPFAHPLYILFSSGTTGVPKCIVHSAGGTLLQHLKEHVLHCDLKAGERLFYFTTCGWMMWNWLVTGLAVKATLLLFDGSPFAPTERVLFDFADDVGMNVFGTSAKYIDACKKTGLRPRETHDLSSVRMMTSTGSPLAPESFDYVYADVKPDIHLASVSGGTDIVSCFVLGSPLKPMWRGEIQVPGLAMDVDVAASDGATMDGGKGELVCRNAFPSMPVGFWNDDSGEKYHRAYFARFENVWHHGDFAEWTPSRGMIIHGRSDATLNPGGVRIGTAEIYRQVEQLEEIMESVVIGQQWDHDVRIVLFVVLRDGAILDEDLEKRIRTQIRTGASPRHVPAKIVAVPDIPRTKSGKITELAIRDVVHGRDVANTEALANPEALEHYRRIDALRV